MELVTIGEFARQSRLSPKALRLYDELGLLAPATVDPVSGYRWYQASQLENARLVSHLRRLGLPLAKIKCILELSPTKAAGAIETYWTTAELEHLGRRELVQYLVDHLHGRKTNMYEVATREIPERTLLSKLRHARNEELIPIGRDFLKRFRTSEARLPGPIAGAPFVIYHGEVSGDSDGPVEWCWPVLADRAAESAAGYPDLTVRVEPAHEEAYVSVGAAAEFDSTRITLVMEALMLWTNENDRQPSGSFRQTFRRRPQLSPELTGPDTDFSISLRPVSAPIVGTAT